MRNFFPAMLIAACSLTISVASAGDKEKIIEAHGKMSADMKKDPQRYQRECDQGKIPSCTREGIFYAFGTWGHKKDYAKAKPLFEKGCNGGDQDGCKELAGLYQYGRGTAKDETKALSIYTKACTSNNSTSCYYAAELHQYGRGTKKDLTKARELLSKACSGGYKSACTKKI